MLDVISNNRTIIQIDDRWLHLVLLIIARSILHKIFYSRLSNLRHHAKSPIPKACLHSMKRVYIVSFARRCRINQARGRSGAFVHVSLDVDADGLRAGVFRWACMVAVLLLSGWLSGLRRDVVQPMERRIRTGRYLRIGSVRNPPLHNCNDGWPLHCGFDHRHAGSERCSAK